MADFELDPEPGSTIGATEAYKEAWHAKYGDKEAVKAAQAQAEADAQAQEDAAKAQAAAESSKGK